MPDIEFGSTLAAELAKKSGLVWITYDGSTHIVWHEWVGGGVCVVAGGREQPLPGIEHEKFVTLGLRSKATRQLVAEAEVRVEVVGPNSPHWDEITKALKSGRLNLTDPDDAIDRWARECVVVRLVPTGRLLREGALDNSIGHSTPRLSGS